MFAKIFNYAKQLAPGRRQKKTAEDSQTYLKLEGIMQTGLTATSCKLEQTSFENFYKMNELRRDGQLDRMLVISIDIDKVGEQLLKDLLSLLSTKLSEIFERNAITLNKPTQLKLSRSQSDKVFGRSLKALVRHDQELCSRERIRIPLFLEGLLLELTRRGTHKVGVLRIPGNKQATELLYNALNSECYENPKNYAQLLRNASVHDLGGLLKRWLRELPQPLLTDELIATFYHCHRLAPKDQMRALANSCQMLARDNRNTLRWLLRFLNDVVEHCDQNKMNINSVATIMAPALFPPQHMQFAANKKCMEEQVIVAAVCAQLTKILITYGETLFQVPLEFIELALKKQSEQHERWYHRYFRATSALWGSHRSHGESFPQFDVDGCCVQTSSV